MLRRLLRQQHGFTIIEVMVAAVVLAIGLAAVVTMLDTANATDTTTKAREQGVALARELIEGGRSIPYSQLTPSSIVGKVQAMPGLGNAGAGPGWTIQRRGVTYTVAMGTCAVDDPSDGYGPEDPNLFCASMSGQPTTSCSQLLSAGITGNVNLLNQITGTLNGQLSVGLCGLDLNLTGRISDLTQADVALCILGACQQQPATGDSTPDDYRRIEATVTWTSGGLSHYVIESTAVNNPGQAAGPHVNSLAINLNPLPAGFVPPALFTSDPLGLFVPFTATTDPNATAVQWSVNGVPQGSATFLLGAWGFNWPIGSSLVGAGSETLDGNYTIGAIAYDTNGNAGPPLSMTVTLNRRQAYAPKNFVGGHDGSVVDFQWTPNKEGDITGYQVYRVGALLQPDVLVCSTTNVHATSCQDTNPGLSSSIQYYVRALDTAPNGSVRMGDKSNPITVTTSNIAPYAPTNLQASTSNGNTILLWTAPSGPVNFPNPSPGPDQDGEQLSFYRIYRDGQAVANRYDTAPASAVSYTDTQTGGVQHTYWVTAVDPQLAESAAAGPVTK